MNINFPLLLVILTGTTGLIWLIDACLFRPARLRRHQDDEPDSQREETEGPDDPDQPWLVEVSRSFFPILFVVLLLRSFLMEPFQIPSGSMLPTLEVGDFILVNKFAYGLRLPALRYEIISLDDPERGDIMVFRYPEDSSVNYIKRVVGTPGDHVRYENKRLYINGQPLEMDFQARLPSGDLFEEKLGGEWHRLMYDRNRSDPAVEGEWVVPDHHYFMVGDNRDNSRDSRYWGMVPDDHVVGKAFAIWMHWDSLTSLPSFHRVGWVE